ncbi:hypothetical protein ACQ4PT_020622 [Festuca glaucescens]
MSIFCDSWDRVRLPNMFAQALRDRRSPTIKVKVADCCDSFWKTKVFLNGDGGLFLLRGWLQFSHAHQSPPAVRDVLVFTFDGELGTFRADSTMLWSYPETVMSHGTTLLPCFPPGCVSAAVVDDSKTTMLHMIGFYPCVCSLQVTKDREDFDYRIMECFIKFIMKKYNKGISQDNRALGKLRRDAERAKRALSNQHQVHVEIESLFDGTDLSEQHTCARFEKLNSELFRKTMGPVKKAMNDADHEKSRNLEIVLVCGSTRIPKVH